MGLESCASDGPVVRQWHCSEIGVGGKSYILRDNFQEWVWAETPGGEYGLQGEIQSENQLLPTTV